jgi:hypothetical protein
VGVEQHGWQGRPVALGLLLLLLLLMPFSQDLSTCCCYAVLHAINFPCDMQLQQAQEGLRNAETSNSRLAATAQEMRSEMSFLMAERKLFMAKLKYMAYILRGGTASAAASYICPNSPGISAAEQDTGKAASIDTTGAETMF